MSVVYMFDELVRGSQALLQNSCENKFLSFLENANYNRRRWEAAELECQRLSIELNATTQDKESLEQNLENARSMLDNEFKLRKKIQTERDNLRNQLSLLRALIMDDQFADDVKLNKIRSLGNLQYDAEEVFQPDPTTPKGILKKRSDFTEDISVKDVEDFSFDDTEDLCNSRRRSQKRSRSRSAGRRGPEQVLENLATPKEETMYANKRHRRSRSVVAFQHATPRTEGPVSSPPDTPRHRAYSATVASKRPDQVEDDSSQVTTKTNHQFTEKTVIKTDKCAVCNKRMGFGRIVMKCCECRLMVHTVCCDQAPVLCLPHAASPDVCKTPSGVQRSASIRKRQYFASPILR